MFGHLGGLLGIVPPLIVYLVFKDRGPFVKDQTTEALNFQLTVLGAYIVAFILSTFLFFPLTLLVWLGAAVFAVLGGLAANRGETYRYPVSLRLIK
jgi:uncharacterized Tic20 family protein